MYINSGICTSQHHRYIIIKKLCKVNFIADILIPLNNQYLCYSKDYIGKDALKKTIETVLNLLCRPDPLVSGTASKLEDAVKNV